MAYSGTNLRLLKKKSIKTRTQGAQKANSSSLRHGAYSDANETLLDGRSALARYLAKTKDSLAADLGGYEALSAMELVVLKRVMSLERRIVLFENRDVETPGASDDTFLSWVNSQRLLLAQLGLKRRKKSVSNLVEAFAQSS